MRRHLFDCLDHQLPRVALHVLDVARLREPSQLVVRVVLVAVLDEQIARGFPDPHADHVLAIFLQLEHERREIGIAGQENERPDLGPREDELERVNREADVGRVFLVGAVRRREDQIDRRLGQRHDVLGIPAPVCVGALHGDLSADDLRLEQAFQLGLQIRADRHGYVVEVDHQRGVGRVGGGFFVSGAWQMIVSLLRCHNVFCSCPEAGQARRTFLDERK